MELKWSNKFWPVIRAPQVFYYTIKRATQTNMLLFDKRWRDHSQQGQAPKRGWPARQLSQDNKKTVQTAVALPICTKAVEGAVPKQPCTLPEAVVYTTTASFCMHTHAPGDVQPKQV